MVCPSSSPITGACKAYRMPYSTAWAVVAPLSSTPPSYGEVQGRWSLVAPFAAVVHSVVLNFGWRVTA